MLFRSLMAENRILRHQMTGRVQLTDNERQELAELGAKLGKQALQEIATLAKPDTILAWNRKSADQQPTRKVKKLECANAEKVTRPHPAKESDYQRTSTR